MEIKKLIRIEHPKFNNRGIFSTMNEICSEIIDKDPAYEYLRRFFDGFPIWARSHNDMLSARRIMGFTPLHFCGYLSIDIMKEFIMEDELNAFICVGYKVYEIEVSQMITDEVNQGCFTLNNVISKKDITNLFI